MKPIDYTKMETNDLLFAMGDDGARWADSFCQHAERLGYRVDYEWMIGWFANAIEYSGDFRKYRQAALDASGDDDLAFGNALRIIDDLLHKEPDGDWHKAAKAFLAKYKFRRLCR